MLSVGWIQHVAVIVTDVSRARQFYSGVLGLREIPRPDFDFGGVWYEVGEGQLHLTVHPPSRTIRGTRQIDSRDGHVAFRVNSYRETVEHLHALGVECLESPNNKTPWAQIYVTDPDGNVIELNAPRE